MIVAITSTGNSLESFLDSHFGRCKYFVIYNTENKNIEYIYNQYEKIEEEAGLVAAKLISSKNVTKVISGDFGIKIKTIFDKLKIQMIVIKNSKIRIKDIIEMLNHKSN